VKKAAFVVDNKINGQIRAREVRITGEGIEPKIISITQALQLAQELELDLIEIAPNANPPVCKIMDFGKFLYEKKLQDKKNKKNKTEVKEIKLRPGISDHDLSVKAKAASGFLTKGDKVKVTITFKGRENTHKEFGTMVMLKFIDMVEETGLIENEPQFEGNKMISMFKPKKK
jgi:translation initiation factor IF-3